MSTAYIVAQLRPDGTYLLDIFSEPTPTERADSPPAVFLQAEGNDYREAVRNVISMARSFSGNRNAMINEMIDRHEEFTA